MTGRAITTGGVVLVVDDVERNLQVLGGILTARSYEVLFATSGAVALERIAARPPDLVLLDLMMPGMDGMEVCRRLKADPKTLEIPVIFLTAADEAELAARALDAGAVDYIVKPFNAAELIARVRTHVSLKRTRDELHRIIAQKNELMSVVAHDLKNPIASIRFSAMLLREQGVQAPDPRGELVDAVVETCEDALAFINRRLEENAQATRLERITVLPVDALSVLHLVARENLPAADRKGITVDLDFADDLDVRVQADEEALCRVLSNLLSNAIKFTPSGGRVAFGCERAGAEGRRVRFWVRDTGPGITAEDRKHLFEPYRRLSARPTGGESSTGLGLSISRDLAAAMGGSLDCATDRDVGAEFWIELPRS